MKRLPADEKRHFCYTSAVKVAFNFCYTSALKVPSSSIKLQNAFSVRRELLHGFARDLRESVRARFCYTSAPKVAFQSGLQHIQVAIKLQNAFSVRRELLHGFARDLRESANAQPKSDHLWVTFSLGKSGQVGLCN